MEKRTFGRTGLEVSVLELKAEKVIRFTGLGGTTAYQLPLIMATGSYDVVLTAFNYSLLWREAAIAVFPEARRQNMGLVIGSPLQQGALSRRYPEIETGAPWLSPPRREQYRRLYAFLDETGLSLPEAALRMIVANPDVSTVLAGARSVQEVEESVRFEVAGDDQCAVVRAAYAGQRRVPGMAELRVDCLYPFPGLCELRDQLVDAAIRPGLHLPMHCAEAPDEVGPSRIEALHDDEVDVKVGHRFRLRADGREGLLVAVQSLDGDVDIGDLGEALGMKNFPMLEITHPTRPAWSRQRPHYPADLDSGWSMTDENKAVAGRRHAGRGGRRKLPHR